MNILIVGGRKKADFLLKSLVTKKHDVTLIHDDYEYCKVLSRKYDAKIICGDGSKNYILEESNIFDADILISMAPKDADNLVICQLAKKIYGVKKVLTTVNNPRNVEVFKKLGIDNAVSSSHIVSDMIEQMATINDIYALLPIENGQVNIMEIVIKENYFICNKFLKDIEFLENAVIGCITRGQNSIIPKGNTQILQGDKLLIISYSQEQENTVRTIVEGVKNSATHN
ncbi:NAD-binding protein (plasmid) [Paraclostridium ghonii]|uniref:potassium channel family protein n=1 Tax=Paraclostridium ghonii TaxID=29358 RepID=UPI00202CF41C|nr:NAD-binding protein [Paeniclostridium ghonii]MCM0165077.1 NAD-binding protein [Paeniclostridium ghonii]